MASSGSSGGRQGLIFRQRFGRINLQAISTCSLGQIIQEGKVEILQRLLDEVTFSEFTGDDVSAHSVESIAKLVNVMQLIIEYLLQTQEAQMKVMKSRNEQIKSLKKEKIALERTQLAAKEEAKAAHRQLKILKDALIKTQELVKYPDPYAYLNLAEPRIVSDPVQQVNRSIEQVRLIKLDTIVS